MCQNVTNDPIENVKVTFLPELGPEAKVTMTGKQYWTFRDHKMYIYPHTKFGITTRLQPQII